MSILRDYLCCFCEKTVELFDDDEEIEMCPYCGMDGLKPTISVPNVKTSSKSKATTSIKSFAGMAIRVKSTGEIGEKTPINVGQVINVTDGDKVIICPQKDPDPKKLQFIAQQMTGTKKPPESNLH